MTQPGTETASHDTYRWDMTILYKDGVHDAHIQQDFDQLKQLVASLLACTDRLSQADDETACSQEIARSYRLEAELTSLLERLAGFLYLSHEADTQDATLTSLIVALETELSQLAPFYATRAQAVAQTSLGALMEIPELETYRYRLTRQKAQAEHQMSSELEALTAKLQLSGGEAWGKLHGELTSTMSIPLDEKVYSLPEIRNLAYHGDAQVRKRAFDAELHAYKQVEVSLAYAMNCIKRETKMLDEQRGFLNVLDESAFDEDVQPETLEALLNAIDHKGSLFWRYFTAKAKLLTGSDALDFCDLFAPVGSLTQEFSPADARTFLVEAFSDLHQPIADTISRAYDENWIDFYPRSGKVGGAFCEDLYEYGCARVLHNYDGTLNAVITLAHELGHAYHGLLVGKNPPLSRSYGMTVAETASTFNETHALFYALERVTTDAEKLSVLDMMLCGISQTICDIYSRFLFEKEVIDRCDQEFLNAEALCDIMKRAQIKAYGTGLNHDALHPYMWAPKGHYYSTSKPFYNYPYAFGSLLSMGLYQRIKDGSLTIEQYDAFLSATSLCSVDGCAQRCNITLSTSEFWNEALDAFEPYVVLFEELVDKTVAA